MCHAREAVGYFQKASLDLNKLLTTPRFKSLSPEERRVLTHLVCRLEELAWELLAQREEAHPDKPRES